MKSYFSSTLKHVVVFLALFAALIPALAFGTPKNISGSVKDQNGEPLIGASIMLPDGSGTITDINGDFSLNNVPDGSVLTVSYIGFKDVTVNVTDNVRYDIVLEADTNLLDDVVVIGYGVQKKSNVTGAISSVKEDDLLNRPVSSAAAALQGKVSGVQVINNSGAPGASTQISVRGYSSNGNSNPLYIVDGLKVGDIDYLDPSSISSIEILKDAASAAIYGAEAGNGVILITTKGGGKGNTSVTFDSSLTLSNLAHKVNVLNAEQYKTFYTEAAGAAFTQLYEQYYMDGTDTDWQDEFYETGVMQKYNIGVQGGNDKGSFYINLGYVNNNGMVIKDKDYYKRITGQINASYNIRKWLEVGTSNTITYSDQSSLSESNISFGTLKGVLQADPLTQVYYDSDALPNKIKDAIAAGLHPYQDADGNYYGYSWSHGAGNPVHITGISHTNSNRNASINGMTYANIKPIKNLVFTSRLGYTLGGSFAEEYNPTRLDGFWNNEDNYMALTNQQALSIYYQWENFANYTVETEKAGTFTIMAGMNYSDSDYTNTYVQTNEISSEAANFRYLDYSTAGANDSVKGNRTITRKIAYFGRLGWDYKNRYNAQFNFRADSYDSSYLDLDHNWGYFPSASFGWTFSEENFMKGIKGNFFNYGKIRASYGVNGSISNLGGYMYASTLNTGTSGYSCFSYILDNKLVIGTYPGDVLANPLLRWERSKQLDFGLDLRFLGNRLTMTADYYDKLTEGMLVSTTAPLITGSSSVYQNVGEVVNRGLDYEIEWKDQIGDFSYGIKGNISTLYNNVKKYKGEGTRLTGTGLSYFEEGYPVWYMRGYQMTGIDSSTGAPVFADLDKSGDISEADKTQIGSSLPDFTYGLTLNMAWKGFDLLVYGAGSHGNDLYYGLASASSTSWNNRPMFLYEGRWTSSNTTAATMPSAVYQLNDSRIYSSDALVFDASFFKIKQIQLGYSVPKKCLSKVGLNSFRLYMSLDNFFTFTKYPGSDPETNAASTYGNSALSVDYGGYPISRSVTCGVNVSF